MIYDQIAKLSQLKDQGILTQEEFNAKSNNCLVFGSIRGRMKNKWLVIIILAVSQFVMILDSTVTNVSISNVAKDPGHDHIGNAGSDYTFTP